MGATYNWTYDFNIYFNYRVKIKIELLFYERGYCEYYSNTVFDRTYITYDPIEIFLRLRLICAQHHLSMSLSIYIYLYI